MKKLYLLSVIVALLIVNLSNIINAFKNYKGIIQYKQKNYIKAFESFPNNEIGFYNKANSLYKQGNYKKAIGYYLGLNFDDKKQYFVYHNLGDSYFKLGEKTEKTNLKLTIQNRLQAISFYKKALDLGEKFHIDKKNLLHTHKNLEYVLNKLKQLQAQQKSKQNKQTHKKSNKSSSNNQYNDSNQQNSKKTNSNQQNESQKQTNNKSNPKKQNKSQDTKNSKQNKLNNQNNSSQNKQNQQTSQEQSNKQNQFNQQIENYIKQLQKQQNYYMKYFNKKYQPQNNNPFDIQIIDPITGQPIFNNDLNENKQKDW